VSRDIGRAREVFLIVMLEYAAKAGRVLRLVFEPEFFAYDPGECGG
jgi:hypothetical protein